MLSVEQFFSFLLAACVITISPGPDNMMVLSLGMAKGRMPAVAFGLGCACGCLSHTLLAVLGVSALIAASATAFTALRVCGGLYLVWLGVHAFRRSGCSVIVGGGGVRQTFGRLFIDGVLANAINPKVILFFLSFLPQFVVSGEGRVSAQMAWLGVTFVAQAAVIFALLGYFSGSLGQWVNSRARLGWVLDSLTGALFVGLGLRLIVIR